MPFAFSIVKSRIEERGLQYGLTLDVGVGDHAIRAAQGFSMRGHRTRHQGAATYSLLQDKGNWQTGQLDG